MAKVIFSHIWDFLIRANIVQSWVLLLTAHRLIPFHIWSSSDR